MSRTAGWPLVRQWDGSELDQGFMAAIEGERDGDGGEE